MFEVFVDIILGDVSAAMERPWVVRTEEGIVIGSVGSYVVYAAHECRYRTDRSSNGSMVNDFVACPCFGVVQLKRCSGALYK